MIVSSILIVVVVYPVSKLEAYFSDSPFWFSSDTDATKSIAWGDLDGDGDLDLAVGNTSTANYFYINEGNDSYTAIPIGEATTPTRSVAWGDADGDGDLDLAVGNNGVNQLYINQNDGDNFTIETIEHGINDTHSVVWGDADGDGDLDLAVGNRNNVNQLYINDGNATFTVVPLEGIADTRSVAWGDADGDGDLDLAIGNWNSANQLYINENDSDQFTNITFDGDEADTNSVAWGDLDGDGDLDLAVGNWLTATQLYINDGGVSFTTIPLADNVKTALSVAWGDVDMDDDLDLVVGNNRGNQLYINNEGNLLDPPITLDVIQRGSRSIALGDVDGDGDLDLAVGNDGDVKQIYKNDTVRQFIPKILESNSVDRRSLAWGDVDGDGDLDLAVGNIGTNTIYLNDDDSDTFTVYPINDTVTRTHSIAWGDADGDGDLDLAIGNDGINQIYFNEDSGEGFTIYSIDGVDTETNSIAWGDADGDGDLDLAVGNNGVNRIYFNEDDSDVFTMILENDSTKFDFSASSYAPHDTRSVAWGDADGDGDLDLAVGNWRSVNQLYINDDASNTFTVITLEGVADTQSVAWGDADGDGDLDLAVGNDTVNQLYVNNDDSDSFSVNPFNGGPPFTRSLEWGDVDGDGDLDLVSGNVNGANQLYINENESFTISLLDTLADTQSVAWGDEDGDGMFEIAIANESSLILLDYDKGDKLPLAQRPSSIALSINDQANYISEGSYWESATIPIVYHLFDALNEPIHEVNFYFSLDGGGHWQEAIPTPETTTTNLSTLAYPTITNSNTYTFTWDTLSSGFYGQSDNVVLRAEALHQTEHGMAGEFQYKNYTPHIIYPFATTTSLPLRIRGTQIRVVDIENSAPISNAIIYHTASATAQGAVPLSNHVGIPYRTNESGYLLGRGVLSLGDHLFAMKQISSTMNYTLYHTSGAPTQSGVTFTEVTQPGVQQLVISAENPLILLPLTVSLEWDARKDQAYLDQLERDLQRTSEILFDLSNGQMALGEVTIYQAGENADSADLIIYARNDQRPNANLGGIVTEPITDTLSNDAPIPYAFLPGQIRMGATWSRYGNPGGTLGEDWPRALAHEIGHYALFLLDNYIGLNDAGQLIATDCQGSAMTDAYREEYSELLVDGAAGGTYNWSGDCLQTVAAQTTGRSDWETVLNFYPFLNDNIAQTGVGPIALPIALTEVTFAPVEAEDNTLLNAQVYLTDEDGLSIVTEQGKAQAYLFKTQNTATLTDDVMIPLGAPLGSLVNARGMAAGDKVCVFDQTSVVARQGCLATATTTEANTIEMPFVEEWHPEVVVLPIDSTTIGITVTQAAVQGDLRVQVLPSYRPTVTVQAQDISLTSIGNDRYYGEIQFPMTVLQGHVRVWETGSSREFVTPYLLSIGWDGNSFAAWGGNSFTIWDGNSFAAWGGNSFAAWGGNSFAAWGGNSFAAWGAPVSAPDGQVKLYYAGNILGQTPAALLRATTQPPNLPGWLSPIGQAYYYRAVDSGVDSELTIQFQYLQRAVPNIAESELAIYFHDDVMGDWQRLPTTIDERYNLAAATVQGNGTYALIATVQLPPFAAGWNNFGYPIAATRNVTTALASIDGFYTSVYHYDAFAATWSLYDGTVRQQAPPLAPLVNDLTHLEHGQAYWLHATQPITGYLGVDEQRASNFELPPVTFYGWVTPTVTFQPTIGDTIQASINGNLCGETTITSVNGQLAYVLQVSAEKPFGSPNGCGTDGATIDLRIGATYFANALTWHNEQATYSPIAPELVPTTVAISVAKANNPSHWITLLFVMTVFSSSVYLVSIRREHH